LAVLGLYYTFYAKLETDFL